MIEDVQESDCGSYTFEVADEEGVESVNASIIMKGMLTITLQTQPYKCLKQKGVGKVIISVLPFDRSCSIHYFWPVCLFVSYKVCHSNY